ncbi:pyridoxal-phosphate dependent enzyme [Gracilimonas sp.]|uniref:threonine ammonia-lyase n=1 Tax=Gracilimonas sp. TaxID=1974203 RepID=UPI0032ED2F5A
MIQFEITPNDIIQADNRISNYIVKTPVLYSQNLKKDYDLDVKLKLENQQVSGSFKPRGSINKILKTRNSFKDPSYVAPTAGGHGVGLSYAGKVLGVDVEIHMPKSADKDRIRDIKENGAKLFFHESVEAASIIAKRKAKKEGKIFVSAYDDLDMIEGAGTMAFESMDEFSDIDCLVCGVGGGGYISGMAIILKSINPDLHIIGVQQNKAAFLKRWYDTQKYPGDYKLDYSIAEGIGGYIEKDCVTWPIVNSLVDEFISVSENDIKQTLLWMLDRHKVYTEPSGVVGLTAIMANRHYFKKFNHIFTVISGQNMSLDKFKGQIMN